MPNPTPRHPVRKLTKSVLDSIKPGSKGEFHWSVDPVGFGVRCTPTGKISFFVQGGVEGGIAAPARLSIGCYGGFTVDQARDIARERLRSMCMGSDPRNVKREDEAKAVTLQQVSDAFFARPGMLKDNTCPQPEHICTTSLAQRNKAASSRADTFGLRHLILSVRSPKR